jgi:hypothetical protein
MAVYQFPYADLNKVLARSAETDHLPSRGYKRREPIQRVDGWHRDEKKAQNRPQRKDFFFPQEQPLVKFRREGQKIEIFDQRNESVDL